MKKTARLLIGAVVLVVALFVAQRLLFPPSERKVERAIETVATSANPAYCRELTTDRYLEQVTGEKPPFADDVCESEARDRPAGSVEIDDVEIDDDRATARVTYAGGSLDGSRTLVGLAKEGGDWKMDRLLAIPELNRAKFRAAFRRGFLQLGYPAQAADCAVAKERRLSDAQVKRALLHDRDATFGPFLVECARGRVERDLLYAASNPAFGLSGGSLSCIKRGLRSSSATGLVLLRSSLLAYGKLIFSCDESVFLDYAKGQLESDGDLDPAGVRCAVEVLRGHSAADLIRFTYDRDRFQALTDSCDKRTGAATAG